MYSHPNNHMREAGHSKCSVRFMFLTFKGKDFVLALHLFVPNKDENLDDTKNLPSSTYYLPYLLWIIP
jgi:hypothetical protein